jgi:protein-disulfide isomerase
MRNLLKFSALFLLLSLPLLAQTTAKPAAAPAAKADSQASALPPGAPSVELTEAYFKRVFGYDPNLQVHVASILASPMPDLFEIVTVFVTPEGQQVLRWYVSKDLQHAIVGELRPFGADPYEKERKELAKSAFGPTKGPVNAKLLFVEFADLECPSCREAQPAMEKLYADYPDARFIFQSFPLTSLHPWAFRAASYLDCIARTDPEKAFVFADAVFKHQREIESIVHRTGDDGKSHVDEVEVNGRMRFYTDTAGADPNKIQACADSPETKARIDRGFELGKSVGVTGTPTLFLNGRLVGNPGNIPYEALKAVINFEAEQAAAAK